MDEMENRELPLEPEHMEEPIAEAAPAETVLQPEQPPRRRSPYENSPYMTPGQPQPETAPVRENAPQDKPPRKKRRRKSYGKLWLLAVVLLVAVVGIQCMIDSLVIAQFEKRNLVQIKALQEQIDVLREQLEAVQDTGGNSVSGTPNTTPDGSLTPAQVYARNEQSVVLIETDVSTGSGFILTADGYVVTNHHVVEDSTAINVVLYDRTKHKATLVGYEANNDTALLKIQGEDFRPVTLGSSDALIVGDQVAAIGNPLGELTSTLTVGYVSAKERDVSTSTTIINMLQTDCAINSGNSGGPLFNMKGEVVGITTAKYSGMSSSGASIEGIGFAIPMDDVVGILEDLMEFGYVRSGYLGVTVYGMDPTEAEKFNLPMGCRVESVMEGSCAERAGIQPTDIITGLGGHEVEGLTDLTHALRKYNGGESITITVYRSGQTLVLPITLDEKPHEGAVPEPDTGSMPENGSYEEWFNYFFGE